MINQCRDSNINVIIHHSSLDSHSQVENKVFNITSQNRSSGDSNLICGGEFGRISVYSQVKTKSTVQHHAASFESSQLNIKNYVQIPRSCHSGCCTSHHRTQCPTDKRCRRKCCKVQLQSSMNTKGAIDLLQGRFELYQPFCLSSHNADCGR